MVMLQAVVGAVDQLASNNLLVRALQASVVAAELVAELVARQYHLDQILCLLLGEQVEQ